MIGRACHYYCRHRSESVRQTSSYYHTTLQPYRSPEASSSTRQHHEREAAYPRCIGACNPSPRIVRAGGADAYTPATPHQPPPTASRKKASSPPSAWCFSVSCCAGISEQFSNNNHACSLSPFALSMYPTITTQRLCCLGSATGLVFGMYVTDPIPNFGCNNRYVCTPRYTASFSAATGSSSSMQSVVISTASREDNRSTNLQQLVGGS